MASAIDTASTYMYGARHTCIFVLALCLKGSLSALSPQNMPLTAAFCLDSLVNSDLFNKLFGKKDFVTNVRACCYR